MKKKYVATMQALSNMMINTSEKDREYLKEKIRVLEKDGKNRPVKPC